MSYLPFNQETHGSITSRIELMKIDPVYGFDYRQSYEAFGCDINALTPAELFEQYADCGFLYPEKRERLVPYWSLIEDNWHRTLEAGHSLNKVVTCETEEGHFAAINTWRSSLLGWCTQHLVSTGNPLASRAVMLAAQSAELRSHDDENQQNWFRADNRMPRKVFGSIVESLGPSVAQVREFGFFNVQLHDIDQSRPAAINVQTVNRQLQPELARLAKEARGEVYAEADDLAGDDLNLTATDAMYRTVGLRRHRRSWLAFDGDRPIGALIAYRGPLGLNFSFLENRADLIISSDVNQQLAADASQALLASATEYYSDFEPGFIPLTADLSSTDLLENRYTLVRRYCQGIWQRNAFAAWGQHTDRFYTRILQRLAKRRLASAA